MRSIVRLLAVCCLSLPMLEVPAREVDLVAVAAAAKPSIVLVGTYRATDSPRFTFRGTGFVVGDGRQVVTGAHVLPEARADEAMPPLMVQVRRAGGDLQPRVATVQVLDRTHDTALLRIEGEPLAALALADGDEVAEGQSVAMIGFPIGGALGFVPAMHRGIVSAVVPALLPFGAARQITEAAVRRLRGGEPFDVYQLDATAYPGNSGGPLLDAASGRVIGVVSFTFLKSTREAALSQPSGITYAIPIRYARALLGGR